QHRVGLSGGHAAHHVTYGQREGALLTRILQSSESICGLTRLGNCDNRRGRIDNWVPITKLRCVIHLTRNVCESFEPDFADPARRTAISPSFITSMRRVWDKRTEMSEATKFSPSARPITSGGPLRTATRVRGS